MFSNEIKRLLDKRPIPVDEIQKTLFKSAIVHDAEDLILVAKLARMDQVIGDEFLAIPSISILPAWGKDGIQELKKIMIDGLHSSDAQNLLLTIASGAKISSANLMFLHEDWFEKCQLQNSSEIQTEAQKVIREIMLAQATDLKLRSIIINNLTMAMGFMSGESHSSPAVEYFFSEFTDTLIVINKNLIEEFELLLESAPDREEDLQNFLFQNPIFLDPLAIEIRSKHELGSEFKTDFVIKRLNNEYVLVEIEKSTDRIFTQKGVFHSELTEAIAQVRDFQAWIHDNIAYARNTLPEIRRPEGLLVIGRKSSLNPEMIKRLDEENFSRRGHIKIITYDDLLYQAKIIYSNLITHPKKVKGKTIIKNNV